MKIPLHVNDLQAVSTTSIQIEETTPLPNVGDEIAIGRYGDPVGLKTVVRRTFAYDPDGRLIVYIATQPKDA